ncbi:MAG: F0F1 ATP synthase subunit A [Patescibacteria group bacterium]|nr:F0F1 ATP synthase subunit A [Patescibacteria group bacterium]
MIKLEAESIFKIGNFNLTNTYLASLVSLILLSIAIILFNKGNKEVPGKFQALIEILMETIYDFWHGIVHKKSLVIFTFCLTFLIYIVISNWLGLFPGFGSIYKYHHEEKVHILRSVYSDLNMTLALAIVSVIGTLLIGIVNQGKNYFKRFKGFIGGIEIIGELTRLLSFSLRLFGNVFAGETLLIIIGILIPLIIPLPIIILELFVGLIQGIIFFTLTTVFISVALSEH